MKALGGRGTFTGFAGTAFFPSGECLPSDILSCVAREITVPENSGVRITRRALMVSSMKATTGAPMRALSNVSPKSMEGLPTLFHEAKVEKMFRYSGKQISRTHPRRAFILLTFSWPMISVMLTGRRTSLLVDSRWRKASCQSNSVSLSVEGTAAISIFGMQGVEFEGEQRDRSWGLVFREGW